MGIIGDVVDGLFSSSKSKKAAKAVTDAADKNNATALNIYDQNKANLTPFMATGAKAGTTINDFLGLNGVAGSADAANKFNAFKTAGGYNFNLDNGADALNSGNASKGLLKSGAALKALTKYQTGLADTYSQGWLGDLQGQQSSGLSAANGLAGVGSAFVNQTTNNNNLAAGAKADNYLNQANIFSNTLSNIDKRASQFAGFGSSYGG